MRCETLASLEWHKLEPLRNDGGYLYFWMLGRTGWHRAFPQRDIKSACLAISIELECNGLLCFQLPEYLGILLAILDVLPIDADDNITTQDPWLSLDGYIQFTGTESDPRGGASFFHIDDEQPVYKRQRNKISQFIGHKFSFDAQPRSDHVAMGPEFRQNRFHGVNRNGKPDVLRSQQNGRVNANYAVLRIDERPAAVAGIERGRRLNDSFLEHFLFGFKEFAETAHNAC